jgi:putative protease
MKPELILPGGDLERVKIAFTYGADAVYVGLNKHSLRKAEVRFDIPQIKEAIEYAHSLGKRLFVTFNIFAHNEQLADIEKDMKEIAKCKPDAFIMADIGVISLSKKVAPEVPIHVSTQANTVNLEDVKFWRDFGAKRVVLARELTLKEISEIHKAVPEIELEVFVHGSMCISYSGRCLLSNYMTGRHSNLGDCAQPCRWNYRVYSDKVPSSSRAVRGIQDPILDSSCGQNDEKFYLEEKMRPGEYFPIEESEDGTNIMSSKDIALVTELDKLLKTGVIGLKVEGRNKSEYYLASIGYTYRKALDAITSNKFDEKLKKELYKELQKVNHRDYTTGFIYGDAKKGETYSGRSPVRDWEYVGQFIDNEGQIIVKNKLSVDDKVEVLTSKEIIKDNIVAIIDVDNIVDEINPGRKDQRATIKLKNNYPANTFIRKKL